MTDPDLRILARFLPEFERADFSPGYWTQKQGDVVYTMPYATLSPSASEFVQVVYESGWVLRDFNWSEWKVTEEAVALYSDPDSLTQATLSQLAQILTIFVRQDRFIEGSLLNDFKSGHILAIVRRAAQLLEVGEITPQR